MTSLIIDENETELIIIDNLIYKLLLVRGYGPLGQLIKSIEMTMVSDINITIVMIGWRLSGNNEEIPEEENGHGKLCPNVIKHY